MIGLLRVYKHVYTLQTAPLIATPLIIQYILKRYISTLILGS